MFTTQIFSKIFSYLGVTGVLAIVFALIVGGQGFVIKAVRGKLLDQQEQVQKLTGQIETQNKSIADAKIVADDVQAKLVTAEKERVAINNSYQALKNKFNNQPIAVNCPDAVSELRASNTELIKKWNKK